MPITPGHIELITPTIASQVLYHYGYGGYPPGGFFAKILTAWDSADPINSRRLSDAFPGYGAARAALGVDHSGVSALRAISGVQA